MIKKCDDKLNLFVPDVDDKKLRKMKGSIFGVRVNVTEMKAINIDDDEHLLL
jgi:hypothetical protein